MFWRCQILRQPFRFKMFHFRWFTCDILDLLMSVPHVEVVSAVTGESVAVFEKEEFADASVKALKQRLAQQIGVPRFRLRLLQDNCPLGDDQTLAPGVVQLVRMEFLPPDMEPDREIMVACEENDDKLLEQHLNKPRNPNFEDADAMTPLWAAASNGNLRLCIFTHRSRCQQRQRPDRHWSNASLHRSLSGAPWSCPISGGVGCQQRPRANRWWSNASFHGSWERAPWSCPIAGGVGCQQRPRQDWYWRNAFFYSSSQKAHWSCAIAGGFGCQQRHPKTKARLILEKRLYLQQLAKGTLKLCHFWWGRVPTKTGMTDGFGVTPLLSQLMRDTLEVVQFLVGSGSINDHGSNGILKFWNCAISWWCLRTTNRLRRMFLFDYIILI